MFWNNFKALCDSAGKSPNALVKENKWASSGSVTYWKNGTMPKAETLRQIADYFGVTVEYLLTGEAGQKESPAQKSEARKKADRLLDGLSDEQLEKFVALMETMI